MSRCHSCGAEIEWAKTGQGKSMPLDAGQVADGNVLVAESFDGELRAHVVGPGGGNRVSHFATCPNAPMHRRSS